MDRKEIDQASERPTKQLPGGKDDGGDGHGPPSRRRWQMDEAEKKTFWWIAGAIAAVGGMLSAIGQFSGPYATSGLQSLIISTVIAVVGGLILLVGVLLWKRRRRRVILPWGTLVLAAIVLLLAGAAGGMLGSQLGQSSGDVAPSSGSPGTASRPVSAPTSPGIGSKSPSGAVSSVIYRVYSDVYNPPPVPGLSVTKGQAVRVTQNNVNEKWACAQQETPLAGIEGAKHDGDSEIFEVPGQNICLLLGKVGDEVKWRPIGPKFEFVAGESGSLRLMVNEIPPDVCPYAEKLPPTFPNPHCYVDNQGSIEVSISVG